MSQMKPISAMEHMMLTIENTLRLQEECTKSQPLEKELLANASTNIVELP